MISSIRHRALRPLLAASMLGVSLSTLAPPPADAAAGAPLGPAFEVAAAGSREVTAARSANGAFVALYQAGSTTYSPLVAQLYNANGSVNGAPVTVTSAAAGVQIDNYSAAMDGSGNFVVAWDLFNGGQSTIEARRFDAAGVPQGAVFLPDGAGSSTHQQLSPAVAMNAAGQFVITWLRSNGIATSLPLPLLGCLAENSIEFPNASIAYRRYQADGSASGAAAQIAAGACGVELNVVMCFLVEVGVGLDKQLIDGDGELDAPAVAVDAAGNFGIVWPVFIGAGVEFNSLFLGLDDSSITLQRYSAAGIPALQQTVQALPRLSSVQPKTIMTRAPAIATGAAGTTVVWNTAQAAPGSEALEVLTRAYGLDGLAKSLLPVTVANGQEVWGYNDYLASIAATPTGSVLAWRTTSKLGSMLPQRIEAQLLDANGKALGALIDVADTADGNTLAFVGGPTVVSDSAGNFAVFWSTTNSSETDSRTYGRLYSGH